MEHNKTLYNGLCTVEHLNDLDDDTEEDLDETLCAVCGLSPDKCVCLDTQTAPSENRLCTCFVLCSCCPVSLCDCESTNGVQ